MNRAPRPRVALKFGALAVGCLTALSLTSCSGTSSSSTPDGGDDSSVAVTLITKDSVNPYFVAMQEGAKKAAEAAEVDLTIASGSADGDEQSQVKAIENAIAAGQQGILITPSGPGVNSAITKARDAGLTVIALDTPPDPADLVDATFATDNFEAGQLIGQWAAKAFAGENVRIALLDAFNDKIVSVDVDRGQGFLVGMGIIDEPESRNGGQPDSGSFSDGEFEVACQESTQAAQDGGRSAMERCLSKTEDIDLVYAANEPSALGAIAALKAAGLDGKIKVVTVDGGCQAMTELEAGAISATSQQYPLRMAEDGVNAIAELARGGDAPANDAGKSFFNTGVTLVTDQPVEGLDSIDSAEGTKVCW